MARAIGAGAQREEVPAASGTASIHTQAGWHGAQAPRYPLDPRPDGADGDGVGLRTDLRNRFAAGTTRVSAGARRAQRGKASL
jgi:hypothetical protein